MLSRSDHFFITLDKVFFSTIKFFYFLTSQQKNMLWVLIRSPSEALLMSTHNICFRREIRKLLTWYPPFRPMTYHQWLMIGKNFHSWLSNQKILFLEHIFSHFFAARRCDFGVPWPVRLSVHPFVNNWLVSATPPTVFGQSFWNFTDVLAMACRCAYCLLIILIFFFFQLFPLC